MEERQGEDQLAGNAPHVITLASGDAPMPLYVPFVHELVGFTVFRSRSLADGREQFHLHVGYFDSEARAREALAVVRRYYPEARVAAPPGNGAGSLDDTLNTEFRMVRSASARVVAPGEQQRPKAAVPATGPQRYSVRLRRSPEPANDPPIPRLPQFRAFSVYAVRVMQAGIPCQEVRLGFFDDLAAAQGFADSVRQHLPQAGVVPVSEREVARVAGLATGQAQQLAAPPAPQGQPRTAVAPAAEGSVAPAPAADALDLQPMVPRPGALPPLRAFHEDRPGALRHGRGLRQPEPLHEDARGEFLSLRWFLGMLVPREPKARIGR